MKRNNSSNTRHSTARSRPLPFNFIVLAVIVLLAVFGWLYLNKTIRNLPCFKIRDTIICGNPHIDLSDLKGQNIFALDLKKEAAGLKQLYPNFKSVRIIRILPDRLFVDFLSRNTVAAVKLYRLFCVDEESVLFDCPAGVNEVELPLIAGLETRIFGPKSGTKCNFKELTAALNIIKEAGSSRLLKNYRIRLIQAANLGAISFFLVPVSTGINYPLSGENPPVLIEVKVGPDYLRDKMIILGSLLAQNKNKLQTVRYIDLRFTEPVIRYNDVK